MSQITMKELLEAGVHFGHQTKRWNPKMKPYIFGARNGIYIIDLQKTVRKADEAYLFMRSVAMNGGTVLFVGTKKQAQQAIQKEAERCEQVLLLNDGIVLLSDTRTNAGLDNIATYRNALSGIVLDLATPGNNTGDAAGDTFLLTLRGSDGLMKVYRIDTDGTIHSDLS